MHLVQPEIGILGTTSIVGGCLPLAVGAGLASMMRRDGRVSVVYFGDGAMDEGSFYESINIASVMKLPVIFVCEHNYYATHMRICRRIPCDRDESERGAEMCSCDQLKRRADLFYVASKRVDGNNLFDVHKCAVEAVEHARAGRGPYFLECMTYRWRGHVGPNLDVDRGLRSQSEIDAWKERCPIGRLGEALEKDNILSEEARLLLYEEVKEEVEKAIAYAQESAFPSPESVTSRIYR